jgi:hypothetical protein
MHTPREMLLCRGLAGPMRLLPWFGQTSDDCCKTWAAIVCLHHLSIQERLIATEPRTDAHAVIALGGLPSQTPCHTRSHPDDTLHFRLGHLSPPATNMVA